MKKILYINNFEAPYRVPFFNKLAETFDLTLAFFERKDEQVGRSPKWFSTENKKYKTIQLKTVSVANKKISFEVKKLIKSNAYDLVFMDMYAPPTTMFAIFCMNKLKMPFVMSVDGMLERPGESSLIHNIKKYFLNSPEYILSPSFSVNECLRTYGVPENKIINYPFTSVLTNDIIDAPMSNEEKNQLKKQLNIPEKKILITVGRFIHCKGFDVLLKACKSFSSDVGIYFIGGTPTSEYEDYVKDNNLFNIHFIDFLSKDALREYYKCADIFVYPTREDIWGLVINEAMANGLPVISSDRCVAALELVKNGENGYIVPSGNSNEFAQKCNLLLNDETLCQKMAINSLNIIKNYTVEKMAERHIEIFNKFLNEVGK